MLKHNRILLKTHCRNVANIALAIAIQSGGGKESRTHAWWFGLVHDVGWLNLHLIRREKPKPGEGSYRYEHSEVTVETIRTWLDLCKAKEPPLPLEDLREFAHLHGCHRNPERRELSELLGQRGYEPSVMDYVTEADWFATGLEKPGWINETSIFHTFTTSLTVSVTPYRVNMLRFMAHNRLQGRFLRLLESLDRRIGDECNVEYDSILAEDSRTVFYVLPEDMNNCLRERFAQEITEEVPGYTHKELVASLFGRKIDRDKSCIFCNAPSRYVNKLDKYNNRIYRYGLSVMAEFWNAKIQAKRGYCPSCLFATPSKRNLPYGIHVIIALPSLNFITSAFNPKNYRSERFIKAVKQWQKLKDDGKCNPLPPTLTDTGTHNPLLKSSDVTTLFADPDTLRETFEDAKKAYEETVTSVKEAGMMTEELGTVTVIWKADLDQLAETIRTVDYAPILIDALNIPKQLKTVQVGGYTFTNKESLEALHLLESSKKRKVRDLMIASKTFTDLIASDPSTTMKIEDIETADRIYPMIRNHIAEGW